MSNYVNKQPRDTTGESLQEFPPAVKSQARYTTENAVVSSAISLNPNTGHMEIGAVGGQGIVIRWVPVTETAAVAPRASVVASGLGANYDHWVPPGMFRKFAVPKETQGQLVGSGMQIGSVNGLYQRVAVINAGPTPSSMIAIEY